MGEPHGRVSVRENKQSWMNRGRMGGMDEWGEEIVSSVYYIWPPRFLLAPTMSALPCLASRIGVHADGLNNPIAKANNKDSSC